jgi:hypothetical protein
MPVDVAGQSGRAVASGSYGGHGVAWPNQPIVLRGARGLVASLRGTRCQIGVRAAAGWTLALAVAPLECPAVTVAALMRALVAPAMSCIAPRGSCDVAAITRRPPL